MVVPGAGSPLPVQSQATVRKMFAGSCRLILGEDVVDDLGATFGDIGEALVGTLEGVGEAGVIEAEQVEDGGVEIVDMYGVGFHAFAEGVGGAVDGAGAGAATGEPG